MKKRREGGGGRRGKGGRRSKEEMEVGTRSCKENAAHFPQLSIYDLLFIPTFFLHFYHGAWEFEAIPRVLQIL